VLRRGCDPGAAIRLDLDEAVALEANQRLAHRGLRHAELAGKPCLDELLTRAEDAGEDLVSQPFVDAALQLRRNDLLAQPLHSYIVSRLDAGSPWRLDSLRRHRI